MPGLPHLHREEGNRIRMAARYLLTDQIHMRASVPTNSDVIVTLQHWTAVGSGALIYVVTHNGTEVTRKFSADPTDRANLVAHFAATRAEHADGLLSDEAAADEVVRRGGPSPRYCVRQDCPAQIPVPYASDTCAAGDPVEARGRIEFLSVTQRHPTFTVIAGGKK